MPHTDADFKKLQGFAREICRVAWETGSPFGGDWQDAAERHGLIELRTVTESCNPGYCVCEGEFPTECYRFTGLLAEEEDEITPES